MRIVDIIQGPGLLLCGELACEQSFEEKEDFREKKWRIDLENGGGKEDILALQTH